MVTVSLWCLEPCCLYLESLSRAESGEGSVSGALVFTLIQLKLSTHSCTVQAISEKNVFGGLCRCNYCENGLVLDSNQPILLASLVCYQLPQLVLSSGTWVSLITHSHVLSRSSMLQFSSQ